jgi:hypothetical protein
MKTNLKWKNNEFLVTPLKNVLSVTGLINHPRIPKLWTIAHKKAINANTPLKHVLSVMDLVNYSGTPKLWAIAHENDPKMEKQ